MRPHLERFLGTLQQVRTLETLQSAIVQLRDDLDVDHLVYHSVNSTGEQYAALTYSPAWVSRYVAEDYGRIDPVVLGCFQRFQPVDWKTLDWAGRQARGFLGEALDAGVGQQGYSVPIRGPHGQFAMFTVSDRRSDGAWQRFADQATAGLILLAHFANQKALELERGTDLYPAPSLSPRERDALTFLAMGLNRSQAAAGMRISEHTFRDYVETARAKLGTRNTVQTVARATAMGLVII
jgi:DNA-binding CsgD family transcriptional regulator